MRDHSEAIRTFFESYARRMNDALADPPRIDGKAAREAFAAYFVGTDPHHVRGARNGLFFRLMIPRGYRQYRKMGAKRMDLTRVDVSAIDDFHAMARTDWSSHFVRKDGSTATIDFINVYLLHIPEGGEPKIFAWITPDEQQALNEHGIG